MLNYAFYSSRVGLIRIGYEDNQLLSLGKIERMSEQHHPTHFTDEVYRQVEEYLDGKRISFEINYVLRGTPFQKLVWNELCKIPYGQTRTYKQIAEIIGNEKASRAVGMANNKNPIGIIIPCHRVIGSSGKLVGYAGGLEMKESLLKLESTQVMARL